MDVLVLSDSHGNKRLVYQLLRSHPLVRYLLFCGDGLADVADIEEDFPTVTVYAVRGNCDVFSRFDAEEEQLVEIDGVRILLMHGHAYRVKENLDAAASHAAHLGADLLLFGHTHLPHEEYREIHSRQLCLFNPGSIGMRGCGGHSFGIITIKNKRFIVSHGTL